ncbi:unnamed protein product [Thelazia callipaeda]|uniref:Uncharacterized protein n=1 Tax=Thelazia callipaeda TaxID=103827 RepID=A0A0N5CUM7_THECL|nr:unnamed protein product [Thelazia callipaeda]
MIVRPRHRLYGNISNQISLTTTSNNVTSTVSSNKHAVYSNGTHETPQLEMLSYGRKEKQSKSVSNSMDSSNDNFEDLKGRVSGETLNLIKLLHSQLINAELHKLRKLPDENKREEIIQVSGKLEIL